jgi:hypothetical protein
MSKKVVNLVQREGSNFLLVVEVIQDNVTKGDRCVVCKRI